MFATSLKPEAKPATKPESNQTDLNIRINVNCCITKGQQLPIELDIKVVGYQPSAIPHIRQQIANIIATKASVYGVSHWQQYTIVNMSFFPCYDELKNAIMNKVEYELTIDCRQQNQTNTFAVSAKSLQSHDFEPAETQKPQQKPQQKTVQFSTERPNYGDNDSEDDEHLTYNEPQTAKKQPMPQQQIEQPQQKMKQPQQKMKQPPQTEFVDDYDFQELEDDDGTFETEQYYDEQPMEYVANEQPSEYVAKPRHKKVIQHQQPNQTQNFDRQSHNNYQSSQNGQYRGRGGQTRGRGRGRGRGKSRQFDNGNGNGNGNQYQGGRQQYF